MAVKGRNNYARYDAEDAQEYHCRCHPEKIRKAFRDFFRVDRVNQQGHQVAGEQGKEPAAC